jgi:hypothetical protein
MFITNNVEKIQILLAENTQHLQERETFMSEAGFEPRIQGSERPQNHALFRMANRIG